MAHLNPGSVVLSENIEMYLVRVAQLRLDGNPVPISQLAQELAITSVSAHEMCRKLMERGLVEYEPYKGVTLTPDGDALAQRVLRSRHLWATFFMDALGLSPLEADEAACRFEHVTPDDLADRLDGYLARRQDASAPPANALEQELLVGLHQLDVGECAHIVAVTADVTMQGFLSQQAIAPGNLVTILGLNHTGAILLDIAGQPLALAASVAATIQVKPDVVHGSVEAV